MNYRFKLLMTVVGLTVLIPQTILAQTVTVPNNAEATSNPSSVVDQSGALINTQVNTNPLGRSVVGNGIADCTSSGISASTFGTGVNGFDDSTLGGSITFTHAFGVKTCKEYARTQLGRAQLETCLLLISNYSKMLKSGIEISYDELMAIGNVDCPQVTITRSPISSSSPQQPDDQPKAIKQLTPETLELNSTDLNSTELDSSLNKKLTQTILPH